MDTFANRLKELRKEKALSLLQVSKATSLSKTAIHQWETGKAQPLAPAIIALAKFFEVSTDYLLGLED